MKTTTLFIATAFALGALAGCDSKAPEQRTPATPPSSQAGTGASTQNTPANLGQPSQAEKSEGANPTQGQVDPKQTEQQKDFQQKGDGAGPKK